MAKMISSQLAACMEICRGAQPPGGVLVDEPYAPHIPQGWNGVLILGEAQNLSNRFHAYRNWLLRTNSDNRLLRLNPDKLSTIPKWRLDNGNRIGVRPWEDGTLQAAVMMIFGADAIMHTAVSNGILWSACSRDRKHNETPTSAAIEASTVLWRELLVCLKPRVVLTAGAKAAQVVQNATSPDGPLMITLGSSSPRVRGIAGSFFPRHLVLDARPEFKEGLELVVSVRSAPLAYLDLGTHPGCRSGA